MGTKIEYCINLLATSVDSNNLSVGRVDVWEHYYQSKRLTNSHHRTGTNKLQDPMDRMLDGNNIESIKKTMQMHEDIFKHQVRELHRLYSVQKMLMDEVNKEIRQQKFGSGNPMNDIDISHPHFIEQQQQQTAQISYGPEYFHVQSLREDLLGSSRERSTGSCSGGDTVKMQRGFNLEMPVDQEHIFTGARGFDEGEAGPSSYAAFQSCKISSGASDEEMEEVDLTLSIGGSQVKKKTSQSHVHQLGCSDEKTRELNSSASFKSDNRAGDCSDHTTPMSSSSVTFTQERRKGPHWLFKA